MRPEFIHQSIQKTLAGVEIATQLVVLPVQSAEVVSELVAVVVRQIPAVQPEFQAVDLILQAVKISSDPVHLVGGPVAAFELGIDAGRTDVLIAPALQPALKGIFDLAVLVQALGVSGEILLIVDPDAEFRAGTNMLIYPVGWFSRHAVRHADTLPVASLALLAV